VIFGAHVILFSTDAEADRQFLTEVIGLDSVDAGHGWLIFALPPAEAAVHPAEAAVHPAEPADPAQKADLQTPGASLYFMCDDLSAEMRSLTDRGVTCSEVEEARWGSVTSIRLPSGAEVGLYQPKHPTAIASPGPGPATTQTQAQTPAQAPAQAPGPGHQAP
jgi:catechol 2,3-dioxygenase-like lactoylglutathione lyase family enzyme